MAACRGFLFFRHVTLLLSFAMSASIFNTTVRVLNAQLNYSRFGKPPPRLFVASQHPLKTYHPSSFYVDRRYEAARRPYAYKPTPLIRHSKRSTRSRYMQQTWFLAMRTLCLGKAAYLLWRVHVGYTRIPSNARSAFECHRG